MSYIWNKNKAKLIEEKHHDLMIKLEDINKKILYIAPTETRILVGVATNLENNNKVIVVSFQNKLSQYIVSLVSA